SIAAGRPPAFVDPRALSTPELISYIVSHHHAYVFASLPFVDALADRVVAECGLDDADVFALRDEIRVLSGRLRTHLYEEEAVLFPALRAQPIDRAALARELARMDEEHALVRAQIAKVRAL